MPESAAATRRQDDASACACTSGRARGACCGPILDGREQAQTAEALMRARYAAFAELNVDFIGSTLSAKAREDHDAAAAREWAEGSEWLGLQITDVVAGKAGDERGEVEFTAKYRVKGKTFDHRERAVFERENGRWVFADATTPPLKPITREAPRVGRNDPCPCGSGKKYKKCCAA